MHCAKPPSGGLKKGGLGIWSMQDYQIQCINDSNEMGREVHCGPVRKGAQAR